MYEHEECRKEVYPHGNGEHFEYLMHWPTLTDGEPDTMSVCTDATKVHQHKQKVESQ